MIVYHAVQTLIVKVVRGRYFCMCNHQHCVGVSSQNRYAMAVAAVVSPTALMHVLNIIVPWQLLIYNYHLKVHSKTTTRDRSTVEPL